MHGSEIGGSLAGHQYAVVQLQKGRVMKRNWLEKLGFGKMNPWKYAPMRLRYAQAFIDIAQGFVALFTIPFHYQPWWSGSIATKIIRYGLSVRKAEHPEKYK